MSLTIADLSEVRAAGAGPGRALLRALGLGVGPAGRHFLLCPKVDKDFIPGLMYIRDNEATSEEFEAMGLPFTVPSASGQDVQLSSRHSHISLDTRAEYVRLAVSYRCVWPWGGRVPACPVPQCAGQGGGRRKEGRDESRGKGCIAPGRPPPSPHACGARGEAPWSPGCLPLRLHEFDEQVAAVREGMARVVPVPLLSLFTGYELETMVGGSRPPSWQGLSVVTPPTLLPRLTCPRGLGCSARQSPPSRAASSPPCPPPPQARVVGAEQK